MITDEQLGKCALLNLYVGIDNGGWEDNLKGKVVVLQVDGLSVRWVLAPESGAMRFNSIDEIIHKVVSGSITWSGWFAADHHGPFRKDQKYFKWLNVPDYLVR